MKIRISIDKVEAMKAGKDKHGLIVIDVPAESLTPEQRNELAEYAARWSGQEQPQADFYLDHYRNPTQGISEGNPDAVRLMLDRLIEIRRTEAAEKAAMDAKEKMKLDKEIAEFLKKFAENPREAAVEIYWKGPQPASILQKGYPELVNAFQWAKAECEKIEEERKQAVIRCKKIEEERAAQAKAQKEAAENVLCEWAIVNGSELLKARISDNFEWIGLAEREFSSSIVSELGDEIDIPENDGNEELERTTPTLPEIQRLREVRKLLEGKPARCELVWATYDDDNDEDKTKRAELKVTVTTPTDRNVDFYYPAVKE